MPVPYTFSTATSAIPLSELDVNFATPVYIGNASVALGNTISTIGNLTLTNVTVSSVATTFPNSFLSNSSLTIGTTNISLGGTATTLDGLTLSNVTISSGTINIAANVSNATGTLAVANGGTGLNSLTAGYIPYGNGTSAFGSSAALNYSSSGLVLNIGTAGTALTSINQNNTNEASISFWSNYVSSPSQLNNFIIGMDTTANGGGGFIYNRNNTYLKFGTNNVEVMRLSNTGYLGIGTSSPSQPLSVAGNSYITGTLSATNTFGFKNRIINGAMVIDQRNAGASVTPTNQQYLVDRWLAGLTQASKFTVQQNAGSVTPPVGFSNYLGCTSSSAYSIGSGDTFFIQQSIEGFNTADLMYGTANAKTVTLSFWVYSSLTGTFGGNLTNNGTTRSYPFSYSIAAANTWTQISITIPGDTTGTWVGATNGIGLKVTFSLGTGSSLSNTAGAWAAGNYLSATGATSVVGTNGATFYITGVQLEVGSQATSFDFRSYGTELSLCQRYFYVGGNACLGVMQTTSTFITLFRHPVPMRTSPSYYTLGVTTPVDHLGVTNNSYTLVAGSANVVGGSDYQGGETFNVSTTAATAYSAGYLIAVNSGFMQISAEL